MLICELRPANKRPNKEGHNNKYIPIGLSNRASSIRDCILFLFILINKKNFHDRKRFIFDIVFRFSAPEY